MKSCSYSTMTFISDLNTAEIMNAANVLFPVAISDYSSLIKIIHDLKYGGFLTGQSVLMGKTSIKGKTENRFPTNLDIGSVQKGPGKPINLIYGSITLQSVR
ncbi:hypothetical protein GDO78_008124 [Eleutherodactylus coqui]|uniref:Uncharacterized protein n=1 Tax=Eleutherodactylus coqui TaxID=57060 RepID=A0A8J6FC48_ELECQ|nr:hypothetical protein GDO78_008124 [Eleutherodactylus coqui]